VKRRDSKVSLRRPDGRSEVAALDWDVSDPVERKGIMPVPSRRVVLAGVLTAAAVAVPVVALASGSDSPGAMPADSPTTLQPKRAKAEAAKSTEPSTILQDKRAKAEAAKSTEPSITLQDKRAKAGDTSAANSQMRALASSAGISQSRLDAGVAAAKRARGNTPAGIAAFARAAGVSRATAQRVVSAVFGK
jgi:hypothetical protein